MARFALVFLTVFMYSVICALIYKPDKRVIAMIGYITLGTNDFERAAAFYDGLLLETGASRAMDTSEFIAWGRSPTEVMLSIIKPFNGEPASAGNGVMVALAVDSQEKVKSIYKKALELGGVDEGEPGPRGEGGFYAAYFRDLDGNKLNVYYMG